MTDELFTKKMQNVRDVLTSGEGFTDTEVELEAGMVLFRALDARPFKMRRAEFDTKTHFEIAFFVATRMRRVPPPAPPIRKQAR